MKRRGMMKFYTIKLPRFIGGFIRAILGSGKK
ncbi:stage V sporulation protein SpoVM [Gracilibacillus boraciitolerans]